MSARKSKLNRVRKVTKAALILNPEISTTSSTEADFMRNSQHVSCKRKRKRLKRKESLKCSKRKNDDNHEDESSKNDVSDAKFEQILSSLRNIDIQ